MKIYIGFSCPISKTTPFAALIKWVESRPYDHVYVRIQEPMDGEYMIFQASKSMVNLYNKDVFSSINTTIKEYEIGINEDQYKVLWRFVKSMLGIPYSLKEDFGILLMKIFHLSKQPFNDGYRSEFCAKLAAQVCSILEVKMPTDEGSIDPTLLDSILEAAKLPCINDSIF